MTEIIKQRDKLRRDKTPTPMDMPRGARTFSPVLRDTDAREYLWLCPLDGCRRTVRMAYVNSDPLPCCMGGPKPHVKQLLVCENFDIYQLTFYRWMKLGEQLGKPIIYPRNYFRYPVLARGETMRDVGKVNTKDG